MRYFLNIFTLQFVCFLAIWKVIDLTERMIDATEWQWYDYSICTIIVIISILSIGWIIWHGIKEDKV